MIETIPLPTTDDPVDHAFWQGCLDSQLLIQSCNDCGHVQHPPRAMCPMCQSMELGWNRASGMGTIWSYTIPHAPLLPAFAEIAPYIVAVIMPDDFPGLRIVGALADPGGNSIGGIDPGTVAIGMSVRLTFVQLVDDVALPCWFPAEAGITWEKEKQQ